MPDYIATTPEILIERVQKHVQILVTRKWPEILRILQNEEEVKIAFSVSVTDRQSEAGEQASKDNRIKTTISFSERYSDSVESATLDDGQGELPLAEGSQAWNRQPEEQPGGSGEEFLNVEGEGQKSDIPPLGNAGLSNLGELMHQAAAGKDVPQVKVDLARDGDDQKAIWKSFAHACRAAKWPTPCIALMKEAAGTCESADSLRTLLAAHIAPPAALSEPTPEVVEESILGAEAPQEADPALAQ